MYGATWKESPPSPAAACRNRGVNRAYFEIASRANPDSYGPDRETIASFGRFVRANIKQLQNDLKAERYQSSQGRAVAIPKNAESPLTPSNVRPITVFNVRDRIIQRAPSRTSSGLVCEIMCTRTLALGAFDATQCVLENAAHP